MAWIAETMTGFWGGGARWVLDPDPGVHEAGYLKLDASRARAELGWRPRLGLEAALGWLVEWYGARQRGEEMQAVTLGQIARYRGMAGQGSARS